jgi:hypothetical protein
VEKFFSCKKISPERDWRVAPVHVGFVLIQVLFCKFLFFFFFCKFLFFFFFFLLQPNSFLLKSNSRWFVSSAINSSFLSFFLSFVDVRGERHKTLEFCFVLFVPTVE